MTDLPDHGITVTEILPTDRPIDIEVETTAAFVGRALRGPLNTPILVTSFGEFRRRFGDVWSGSSLGPAAQQFFAHGGRRLIVVRVANNARGSLICLPAAGSALVLRALEPGSTEVIRAAVDYDGLGAGNDEHFNLTLQRLDPVSGLVVDQELFSGVSYRHESDAFVGQVLLGSSMARIEPPYPSHRPQQTAAPESGLESGYMDPAQAGTDGAPLSDYDLIGSRAKFTGLFALEQAEGFDLLYLPPPRRGHDLGPAAVLAAERYSRERGAMLIVDPRIEWCSTADALQGVRNLGYASAHMLGYYPRVRSRADDSGMARAVGGAIAGLLCRHDRTRGAWQPLDDHGLALDRLFVPAADVSEQDARRLWRAGLNSVTRGPAGPARFVGDVTFGQVGDARREFARLSVQRFCLEIVRAIVRATRWSLFQAEDAELAGTLRDQVTEFFATLAEQGALAGGRYVVECNAGVSRRAESRSHGVTLVLVFQPIDAAAPVSLTLHLTRAGWRVCSAAFAPSLENCA